MFLFPGNLKLPATVAVFDCGTNSVLLLVARLQRRNKIEPLFQAIASPRLGEGLVSGKKLKPKAVARTRRALKKLQNQAAVFKPDYALAVGTNVFRRAKDGKTVTQHFAEKLDMPLIVLSAEEEAKLEFLGAVTGLRMGGRVAVVDVGGGSSEIIWGNKKRIQKKISLEIGAVRLKEKISSMKKYDEETILTLKEEAARKIRLLPQLKSYPLAVLTGGTATTLAAFSLGLKKYRAEKVHGFKTTPAGLEEQIEKLARLNLTERRRKLAFDPTRADIIVPGGIILSEILRRLQIKKVIISDHGLRWGVIYSYFS